MINGPLLLLAISILGRFMGEIQEHDTLINNARATTDYDFIETIVIGVIDDLKEELKDGMPDVGIPPLDPLMINSLPLNLDIDKMIAADVNLKEAIVSGLMSFNVSDLKIILDENPQINIELTFNAMDIVSVYDIKGTLLQLIPLFGDGVIGVAVQDLKVRLIVSMKNECNMLLLENFELILSLDESRFVLTGLMDNNYFSKLLAEELGSLAPTIINSYSDVINKFVGELAIKWGNKVLAFLQI